MKKKETEFERVARLLLENSKFGAKTTPVENFPAGAQKQHSMKKKETASKLIDELLVTAPDPKELRGEAETVGKIIKLIVTSIIRDRSLVDNDAIRLYVGRNEWKSILKNNDSHQLGCHPEGWQFMGYTVMLVDAESYLRFI